MCLAKCVGTKAIGFYYFFVEFEHVPMNRTVCISKQLPVRNR